MNNTVTVHFEEDDEEEVYKIVTTVRGNSLKNLISNESPLGKAPLGHRVGDRVEVRVNDDYSYFVTIRKIENTVDDGTDKLRKFCRHDAEERIEQMRLTELLKTDQVTISCELFPPKQGAALPITKISLRTWRHLKPAYMSVTYGATGGTSDYTVELCQRGGKASDSGACTFNLCFLHEGKRWHPWIEELKEKQISNILALWGDIPQNADFPSEPVPSCE